MATRTHTLFFAEEDLVALRAEVERLDQDFTDREPYIDAEVAQRGRGRLIVLKAAVDLLAEPAD